MKTAAQEQSNKRWRSFSTQTSLAASSVAALADESDENGATAQSGLVSRPQLHPLMDAQTPRGPILRAGQQKSYKAESLPRLQTPHSARYQDFDTLQYTNSHPLLSLDLLHQSVVAAISAQNLDPFKCCDKLNENPQ